MKKTIPISLLCLFAITLSAQTVTTPPKKDTVIHKKTPPPTVPPKKGPAEMPKKDTANHKKGPDVTEANKKTPPKGPETKPETNNKPAPTTADTKKPIVAGAPAGAATSNTGSSNKFSYIDNQGQQSIGAATIPTGGGIAQWSQANNKGTLEAGGKLYESLSYLGSNGKNYQTQIVATPTNDPAKKYALHFQNRVYGEGDYKEGHVIVLDWNKNPFLVTMDYSNEKGIIFTLTPYKK